MTGKKTLLLVNCKGIPRKLLGLASCSIEKEIYKGKALNVLLIRLLQCLADTSDVCLKQELPACSDINAKLPH